MKRIVGVTVDPSINAENKCAEYIEVPIYSAEPNDVGEYAIIGYVREYI